MKHDNKKIEEILENAKEKSIDNVWRVTGGHCVILHTDDLKQYAEHIRKQTIGECKTCYGSGVGPGIKYCKLHSMMGDSSDIDCCDDCTHDDCPTCKGTGEGETMEKRFNEAYSKMFIQGGITVLLDYPPHERVLDEGRTLEFIKKEIALALQEQREGALDIAQRKTKQHTHYSHNG